VTGAATGTGLLVGVTVAVTVAVAVGVTVRVARGVTVAVGLAVTPGVPEVAVPVPGEGVPGELPADAEAVTDPLAEMLRDGVKTDGEGDGDGDEEHAVSATEASKVSAPQHRAVSLTPSVLPRTFNGPSS
jgi:hypothetical protein